MFRIVESAGLSTALLDSLGISQHPPRREDIDSESVCADPTLAQRASFQRSNELSLYNSAEQPSVESLPDRALLLESVDEDDAKGDTYSA